MDGRKISYVNAVKENNYLPLPDDSCNADIIYICSPNNPCGAAYTREMLEQWVDFANKRNAVILFDSAYEAYIQDENVPHSIYEIKGAKSGFTKDAGRCLASITTLNNVDYLLVVINSSTTSPYNAVKDTITIYDYYNNNYGYKNIINDDTFIKEIPVDFSKEKTYKITGSEDIEKYLKNNTEVTYKYVGSDKVTFNTKKGSKLGVVKIYDGDVLLATSNVYLENNIEYYPIITYIMIGIAVIFVLLIINKIKNKNVIKQKMKKR